MTVWFDSAVSRTLARMTNAFRTALFALLLTAAGCTPWATYPEIEGAAGIDNPGLEPVPRLLAMAIVDVHSRMPDASEEIVYNLPPGVSDITYRTVERMMEQPARYMTEPGEPAIHVVAVRLRAGTAEVDVVHEALGVPGMTTVRMKHRLGGWDLYGHRTWRIRVDVPGPNHPDVAMPEETGEADAEPDA